MRKPDVIIGESDPPYMRRWHVIPRNPWFNIYLHHMQRSDDDRALHDHPWWNLSVILKGGYREHMPLPNGQTFYKIRRPGQLVFRRPEAAHRIELIDGEPSWSLFITGPRVRQWGFWCSWGWRHWKEFTGSEGGRFKVGRGCD